LFRFCNTVGENNLVYEDGKLQTSPKKYFIGNVEIAWQRPYSAALLMILCSVENCGLSWSALFTGVFGNETYHAVFSDT